MVFLVLELAHSFYVGCWRLLLSFRFGVYLEMFFFVLIFCCAGKPRCVCLDFMLLFLFEKFHFCWIDGLFGRGFDLLCVCYIMDASLFLRWGDELLLSSITFYSNFFSARRRKRCLPSETVFRTWLYLGRGWFYRSPVLSSTVLTAPKPGW